MSMEGITQPPFKTPFEDGQGNVSRAWVAWVDSVYKYLNQAQESLDDVEEISGTPDADDYNALVAAINALNANLGVA